MLTKAKPIWIVEVKTLAKRSAIKTYLACAERREEAVELVRKNCHLTKIDGIDVEVLAPLASEAAPGAREVYHLTNGEVIEWSLPTESSETTPSDSGSPPAKRRS